MAGAETAVDIAHESRYAALLTGPTSAANIEPGLILATSIFALPLALAAFPQRQAVSAKSLEEQFWDKGGKDGKVEFNRGI